MEVLDDSPLLLSSPITIPLYSQLLFSPLATASIACFIISLLGLFFILFWLGFFSYSVSSPPLSPALPRVFLKRVPGAGTFSHFKVRAGVLWVTTFVVPGNLCSPNSAALVMMSYLKPNSFLSNYNLPAHVIFSSIFFKRAWDFLFQWSDIW